MNPALASSPLHSSAPPDDPALLRRAAHGDTTAFTTLFQRHYPAIHAFAYRIALCPAEADDIAQETFVQAAQSLATFRGDASFKNWLYTIATNKSRDRFRQLTRRARLGDELATLADTETSGSRSADPTDHASSVAHATVREALATLPLPHREAVALVYFEGLNHAEAARVLDCAESTVSWRVFRARQRLKKILSTCPFVGTPRHV